MNDLRKNLDTSSLKQLACLTELISYISSKWFILILCKLFEQEKCRYSSLMRQFPGISKKVLSNTLQNMERLGFVIRIVQMTYPPQVSYQLSPLGKNLYIELEPLARWGEENLPNIQAAAKNFDENSSILPRTPWQDSIGYKIKTW